MFKRLELKMTSQTNTRNRNKSYEDFKRYKHEIYLDIYDSVIKSNVLIVKKATTILGTNEIHYMVKYYQKIVLNSLFFKDKKILLEYQRWLYRVYFHRLIDLDFFIFFIETFQSITNRYLNSNVCISINELFHYILNQHKELKNNANKKKFLIDHEMESISLAKTLILGDKEKTYEVIKSKAPTLDEFVKYYNEIISNAMKYIGYMWEIGDVSVAKEHLSSNTLNDTVMLILDEYPQSQKKDKHIFISSAPYELHGMGVQIASKVFEKQGYQVTNIGTNIPTKEIKKAIIEFKPDIVLFSATLQTSLLDIALLVSKIKEEKNIAFKSFKIGIAGNAFENMVHPAKTCNADFYMNKLEEIIL